MNESQRFSMPDILKEIYTDPDRKSKYEAAVEEYEQYRSLVSAKSLLSFKSNRTPDLIEVESSIALLYFFVQIDHTILLKNDKSQILDKSWNNVKKHLNSCGKVIQTMRKLRE